MYLNKAIIVGNLTRDPEKKALPNGTAVTNFSLATNRTWKDANGAAQEATDYHNIVVFGRQAETSAQYLKKGQSVMIEGRIQTRSWDGEDGKKNYRTEINAERVQFGPKAGGAAPAGDNPQDQSASSQAPTESAVEYPEADINPEDIPF
jgi:single-strand DNA-binding protein